MTPALADDKFATLRRQAEDILHDQPANLADLSPADVQALIHNLQVHQIELELQNEELRAAQLELQVARDRYADLYNFAPVGYFTLDTDGVIVEANLTGAALLKVDRSSLIGTPLTRFVVPEDRGKYAVYRVGLETSAARQVTEIKLIRPADTPFFARVEGKVASDYGDRSPYYQLTVSDISEEILLRTSRLEVAATLAEGIAHTINNLMTTALGNAELLITNLNQPDARDMLTAISRSARRAGELAQQMLTFAQSGKFQPKQMDLHDPIQQALQHQQHAISKSMVIERQFTAELLWPVFADAAQISQVINNLLSNAIEACNGEGHICISTANLVLGEPGIQANPAKSMRQLTPGRYVSITVEDKGHGMNAEVLARVFEPFFTTKPLRRGMGLAAVYGIIRNHGGDIFIKSEPGHGTEVMVYLPAIS